MGVYAPGQAAPVFVTDKLSNLEDCTRIGLAHRRIDLNNIDVLDLTAQAPHPHASWTDTRDHLKQIIHLTGKPADRFVIVGDTMFEKDWASAAQTAGYLTGERYFAPF